MAFHSCNPLVSWVVRMSPFIPGTWTSSCVLLSPFPVPPVLHMFLVALGFTPRMVIQDILVCIHASEKTCAYVHNHHPIMYLSKMDGNCFGVPPSFKHQGQNDFSPMPGQDIGASKSIAHM